MTTTAATDRKKQAMTDTIIPVRSEYEKLLEEVHNLRAHVIELMAHRDDLRYHICPALQAKYDEKIGSVERELLAAQMYLKEKQRIIEILQAQLNRQEEPSMKEAEKKAHEEYRAYEEDLKKKAEEARRFREHWEKETQWSKHEQAARNKRKRKGSDGTDPNDTGDRAKHSGPGGTQETEPAKNGQGSGGEDDIGLEENIDSGKNGGEDSSQDYGQDSSQDDEQDGSQDSEQDGRQDEDPIHELKRLYRQIVKRLHPDVHPNPTEREKDLLNRANEAYKAGDLDEMRRIWEELAGTEQAEEYFDDTEEGRARLRELIKKLRKRCEVLEEEIRQIKTSFPYTIKILLDDDQALEMKHRELLDQLAEVRELFKKLDAYIAELNRRMNEKMQP